jgi:alcohol dehydrogenase (cytochrome c)
MKMNVLLLTVCFGLLPVALSAQILDPALLTKPATDAWPTYNGDYSGRRFSTLTQIDQSNVKHLTLAWIYRVKVGPGSGALVGGEGLDVAEGVPMDRDVSTIKATPLMVKGILSFATPDNAWAIDARSGRELWHYFWKTKGGIHIGKPWYGHVR